MTPFKARFLQHITLSKQFRYLDDRRLAASHFHLAQRFRGQPVGAYPDAGGAADRVIDRAWRRFGSR